MIRYTVQTEIKAEHVMFLLKWRTHIHRMYKLCLHLYLFLFYMSIYCVPPFSIYWLTKPLKLFGKMHDSCIFTITPGWTSKQIRPWNTHQVTEQLPSTLPAKFINPCVNNTVLMASLQQVCKEESSMNLRS